MSISLGFGGVGRLGAVVWAVGAVAPVGVTLTVSSVETEGDPDTITYATDANGTLYWNLVEDDGFYDPEDETTWPDAAEVVAGGGTASGSFTVSGASSTEEVDFSAVPAAGGNYLFHAVVYDTASESYTNVSTIDAFFAALTTAARVQDTHRTGAVNSTFNLIERAAASGDVRVLFLVANGGGTFSVPSGYTDLSGRIDLNSTHHGRVVARLVSATEAETTVAIVNSESNVIHGDAYVIRGDVPLALPVWGGSNAEVIGGTPDVRTMTGVAAGSAVMNFWLSRIEIGISGESEDPTEPFTRGYRDVGNGSNGWSTVMFHRADGEDPTDTFTMTGSTNSIASVLKIEGA